MLDTLNIVLRSRLLMQAAFLCGVLFLTGCSKTPLKLERFAHSKDAPESFFICRGYGCRQRSQVSLTSEEWAQIDTVFEGVSSAHEERQAFAQAVAKVESLVGGKAGTHRDRAAATIRGHGPYQMDCIDETVNTSLYLQFFGQRGLMHFHEISTPARRGAFIDGAWPHNTAVVKDMKTGQKYAIDSWYGANGDLADVVPLEEWLAGWRPLE